MLDRNVVSIGQLDHGIREGQPLLILDPADGVNTPSADVTVGEVLLWADAQAGALVVVPGATSGELMANLLELGVLELINDLGTLADELDRLLVQHQTSVPSVK